MEIKVLEKTIGCMPQQFEKGDWIDLTLAETVTLKCPQAHKMHIRNKNKQEVPTERTRDVVFDIKLLPLGVAMEIPEGYEAHLLPRSGSFKKYGIIQTNSMGIIDNSYSGDNDEWKLPILATRNVTIPKGHRIAQFRIIPSQKATVWQKIKWLLSSPKIKFTKVESLNNTDRKGIGEGTGI